MHSRGWLTCTLGSLSSLLARLTRRAHGSAPCSDGKGALLGALAILDDCVGAALGAGGALTGRLVDDAEDGTGGGWTCCDATCQSSTQG